MSQSLEEYAQSKVGTFLTADSGPPPSSNDGDLTGQCVTTEKWIFQNFTTIPNPFGARGDARYLGINLVNQGHAVAVPASQAKPGDTVCYEYGQYGHTGTLLSGNRFFQQNANVAGAKRRVLSDGTVVYSATIVALYPSLGGVAPKFYRLKTFKESNNMNPNKTQVAVMAEALIGRTPTEAEIDHFMTVEWYPLLLALSGQNPEHIAFTNKDKPNDVQIQEMAQDAFGRAATPEEVAHMKEAGWYPMYNAWYSPANPERQAHLKELAGSIGSDKFKAYAGEPLFTKVPPAK